MADEAIFRSIKTMTETTITITGANTSEEALAANTGRVYALFQNDSSSVMYISLDGTDAVQHEGKRLNASGGYYEITLANLYKGVVNVICADADKVLLVSEGVPT